ncbi:MAG TPA: phenylalanine--tRNA ligase subunit beta [Bacilli bacterium]|jgi:phenylalanyl-tRNA synthetase beta chain|nr:phenylalanine--tRNA ligase subunit beta [Bacilli bacterium]HPV54918.1 phenylalanine--tRNA ligase subunit beta [Bacilli bacterium]HQM17746.1 phenylalanine--tRNA ligase subunit beta [Bacilli bacterium]
MLVKINWLREFVDLKEITDQEIIDSLPKHALEVDGVSKVLKGTNLIVGHVLECEPHPNSDHLSLCKVDVKTEVLQIVCGAPNVRKGQYVIVALVGAELLDGFKIKKAKIRGIESCGMICSLDELGLEHKYVPEEYQNGIYYFKNKVEAGSDPLKALDFDDLVLDLAVTSNRADLMSMKGMAQEIGAIFRRPLLKEEYKIKYEKEQAEDILDIKIETKDCLLYTGFLVKDIEIKESPQFIKSRLIASGIRPINNVVDITNYILMLFGQPLHAFDYDKVGNTILVRKAKNESINTLDGSLRKLKDEDILITDGKRGIALAGVMGGLETEITEDTKNILLEAAVFNPKQIRRTSRRLDLVSESSIRYERGVDVNQTVKAGEYACYLFQKYASAKIYQGYASEGTLYIGDKTIPLKVKEVNSILGVKIKENEIIAILESLGFEVEKEKTTLLVTVPNRRLDINIKEDLIEEIARLYGYDKMPNTLPAMSNAGGMSVYQKERRKLRRTLASLGLNEVMNYSLLDKDANKEFVLDPNNNWEELKVLQPLSSEHEYLRQNLAVGLVQTAKYNQARRESNLALFEIGKVYYKLEEESKEREHLGILLSGKFIDGLWNKSADLKNNFYLLKSILENIFPESSFKYEKLDYIAELHPGQAAKIIYNDKVVGMLGALHPEYASKHDLVDIYLLEVDLNALLKKELEIKPYEKISKVPEVERDIALLVKDEIKAGDLIDVIKDVKTKVIQDVYVFDLYKGEAIEKGYKSIALRIKLGSYETLIEKEINTLMDRIYSALKTKLGAKLRD